jgi:hypothetical protein
MYDPALGRLMSADSVVPNAYDLQLLNRYSYVDNSPLSLTDPTGHIGTRNDGLAIPEGGFQTDWLSVTARIMTGFGDDDSDVQYEIVGVAVITVVSVNEQAMIAAITGFNNAPASENSPVAGAGGPPQAVTGTTSCDVNDNGQNTPSASLTDTPKPDVSKQPLETVVVTAEQRRGVSIWNGYTPAAGFANHTFTLAIDNKTGREYATRGGPNIKNGDYSHNGFGRILAYSGPYDSSFPDYGNAQAWQYVGTLDVDFEQVVSEMNAYAKAVNSRDLGYNPLGPNSNSYAFGFDRSLGFNPTPNVWPVPGWRENGPTMWGYQYAW